MSGPNSDALVYFKIPVAEDIHDAWKLMARSSDCPPSDSLLPGHAPIPLEAVPGAAVFKARQYCKECKPMAAICEDCLWPGGPKPGFCYICARPLCARCGGAGRVVRSVPYPREGHAYHRRRLPILCGPCEGTGTEVDP